MCAGLTPTQEAEVHSQQMSAVLIEQPSESARRPLLCQDIRMCSKVKAFLMRVYCNSVKKEVPGQVPLDLIGCEQRSRGGVGSHPKV